MCVGDQTESTLVQVGNEKRPRPKVPHSTAVGPIITHLEMVPTDRIDCIVVCAYARDHKMKIARVSENGLGSAVC